STAVGPSSAFRKRLAASNQCLISRYPFLCPARAVAGRWRPLGLGCESDDRTRREETARCWGANPLTLSAAWRPAPASGVRAHGFASPSLDGFAFVEDEEVFGMDL